MFGLGINRLGTSTSRLEGAISGLFKNGEAGVWYDPSDVEASLTWRRNLLEYTESLDNSYYIKANGLTVTANAGVAPDGSQTADRLNFANNNLSRLEKAFPSGLANTSVVYSVWMRTESGSVSLDLGHQGTGKTNVTVTTEWQRFTHTFTDADGSFYPRVQNDEAVTKSVLSWGWQLEYANEATEYQPIRSTFDNSFKQAFPKHTLYQNEYGKTPVTGLGQSVGLMLDKSQGVAFGDEEVTNGGFDSASNWTIYSADAASNISNGVAYVESAGGNAYIRQQLTGITAGKTYVIKFNYINAQGSGLAYVRYAGTDLAPAGSHETGKVSYIFTAGSSGQELRIMTYAQDGASFTIDDVSVKEVKGSHATQSDSTKRPVFARHPERGRVNLLKYTEEFDNSYWSKSFVTVDSNFATSPNGSQTAEKVTETTGNGQHLVYKSGVTQTGSKVFSVYVKQGSGSRLLRMIDYNATDGGQGETYFNITNGTVAQGSGIIESAGNGWYRCSITSTTTVASQYYISMGKEVSAGNYDYVYTGDGSSNFYIWGAQLEEANEATGYQKVVDDYDITESGYKSVYYLQFDGINDTMTIQPISNTTAPVSVFMGHDTQGNTATSAYFLDVEVGRFIVAGAGYYHGSAWVSATGVDPEAKGVTSLISDGTNADYRRDGIEETTGTLANKQLSGLITIFSRHEGTTYHTNGNMYQLVVRGATSTDKEIDQAEEFVAIKTGLKSEVVGLATLDLNFGANTYTARNSNGSVL